MGRWFTMISCIVSSSWSSFICGCFSSSSSSWWCSEGWESLSTRIWALDAESDGDTGIGGCSHLPRRSSRRLQSRMDQIGQQSHSGYSYSRDNAQLARIGASFRSHHLAGDENYKPQNVSMKLLQIIIESSSSNCHRRWAVGDARRGAQWRRSLHVSDQYGSHEEPGTVVESCSITLLAPF